MKDRDWEAESDFNTLVRAQEIKADKKRHDKAIKYGRTITDASNAVIGHAASDKD